MYWAESLQLYPASRSALWQAKLRGSESFCGSRDTQNRAAIPSRAPNFLVAVHLFHNQPVLGRHNPYCAA